VPLSRRAVQGLLAAVAFGALLAAAAQAQVAPHPVSASTENEGPAGQVPLGLLGPRGVGGIKAGVAVAATALLGLGLSLDRAGRSGPGRRVRDALLAALGVAGLACWWNLFQFNFPGFAHPSDTFHYYLGAKYFPELGYTRLYECVAVADAEAGLDAASLRRPMRDLATNALTTTDAILLDRARCTSHFSGARWSEFRHDVDFLRGLVPPRKWTLFQQDHGYNATPAWGLLGHALTNAAPASQAQLRLLWALDPLLLLAMWAAAWWAFGWRLAAVAAIYWGTNYAAPYGWTGGSILRQDWLAASVFGVALLRRDHPAAGGVLLAWAALLRIFPACLAAGVALGVLARMLAERRVRLRPAERRFAAGALACVALGVALSSAAAGGLSSWREFAEKSRTHLSTPLANHVGLATLLSFDSAQRSARSRDPSLADPMERWKEARRARFAERRMLFVALVAGFAVWLAHAAGRAPLWAGAALGVALIPVALELTAYYWSALLLLAFLGGRLPLLAALLCAFSAAGWAASELWHWTDEIHVALSALGALLAASVLLLETLRRGRVTRV